MDEFVERFFGDLTGAVIRQGSFASVRELVRDIKLRRATELRAETLQVKSQGAEILAVADQLGREAVAIVRVRWFSHPAILARAPPAGQLRLT